MLEKLFRAYRFTSKILGHLTFLLGCLWLMFFINASIFWGGGLTFECFLAAMILMLAGRVLSLEAKLRTLHQVLGISKDEGLVSHKHGHPFLCEVAGNLKLTRPEVQRLTALVKELVKESENGTTKGTTQVTTGIASLLREAFLRSDMCDAWEVNSRITELFEEWSASSGYPLTAEMRHAIAEDDLEF